MLCHDPRISNIRRELRETNNVALIVAHLSDKDRGNIDWDEVAIAADDCDLPRDSEGRLVAGSWKP